MNDIVKKLIDLKNDLDTITINLQKKLTQQETKQMEIIYLDKIPAKIRDQFKAELLKTCKYLGIQPNWLMMVMYAESRVNPQAVNRTSNATGLIQFMPNTAKALSTTVQNIYKMNAVQQLEYVQKYYNWLRGDLKSYYDVYAATFFPRAIGKPDDWVLQTDRTSAGIIAKQNPAVNINKDGKITVGEFKQYVKNTIPKDVQSAVLNTPGNNIVYGLGLLLLLFFTSE